jgi:kynurenine 3-monooxygenase
LSDRSTDGVNVVGAGLAGSLLAILLARRGLHVNVFEKRSDPRSGPVDSGRSINLALAARGIRGLESAGVLERIMPLTIAMRGRMVHEHDGRTELQKYGVRAEEVIYSVSRSALNRVLVEAADEFENVELRFDCEATGFGDSPMQAELVDRRSGRTFAAEPRWPVIATDGGGSVLRHALATNGFARVREDLLDHDYKELTIPAVNGRHVLEPNALHIWPRGGFMLIALPNLDGSFTATLFLAKRGANSFGLLKTAADVQEFFHREFPGAAALMPDLASEFFENPQGLLGTVYTDGWHVGGEVLLLGDAAHAIVPFHGQGMNCAFEDCVELDRMLAESRDWAAVFARFERERKPNTDAIAAMALENYVEMRAAVLDPDYQKKKRTAEAQEKADPSVIPRYSMVMFHPEISYADALRRGGTGH